MQEIDVTWTLPTVRDDGSAMPASEIAYTDVSLSLDGGKSFAALGQVRPDATQIVKRSPAPDGAYQFRLVVVGTNGKKGKPSDLVVPVDSPAPGMVTALKAAIL